METKKFKNYEVYKLGNIYMLVSTKLTDSVEMMTVPDIAESGLIMPPHSKIYLNQAIHINCNLNIYSVISETLRSNATEHRIMVLSDMIDDIKTSLWFCIDDTIMEYIYVTKPLSTNSKLDAFWMVIEQARSGDNLINITPFLCCDHSESYVNLVAIEENVYIQSKNDYINFAGDIVHPNYDGEYEVL